MDSLFITAFTTGLLLSITLSVLGNWLRLRGEWLATLGVAQLAAASGLGAAGLGVSAIWGAPVGALLGALVKHGLGCRDNSSFAAMMLFGWALLHLLAANTPLGDSLAHALTEGQLYFSGRPELWAAMALLAVGGPLLARIGPRLLAARLFPEHERANALPARRWHLGFDLFAAAGIAAGTATLGVMGTFALLFLPAWIAFRTAVNWRQAQWISIGVGTLAHGLAFGLALALDQPYAPVLGAVLLCAGLCAMAVRRRGRW